MFYRSIYSIIIKELRKFAITAKLYKEIQVTNSNIAWDLHLLLTQVKWQQIVSLSL